jgi:hypothetical protein
MRQHTSACVSIRTFRVEVEEEEEDVVKCEVEDGHIACVSIRQHASAYVPLG